MLANILVVCFPFFAGMARADTATLDSGDTGNAGGEAPIADAGLGLLGEVGKTVVLNGTSSSDPEGAGLGYYWSQTGGPTVTLKGETTPQPEFTIEESGTFWFTLIVNDGYQDSEPDSVQVVVAETMFGGAQSAGCSVRGGLAAPAAAVVAAVAGLVATRRKNQR